MKDMCSASQVNITKQLVNGIYEPSDYARLAQQVVEEKSYAYIAGGAGNEVTKRRNRDAFNGIQLLPKALVDCTQGTTQTTILNQLMDHPIMLAPVAAQTLVNPDGEIATAQAANAMEAGMILSTLSSKLLEDVAQQTQSTKWFQLYFQRERVETITLVKRAEAAGYQALVVTLDTPIQRISTRAQQLGFTLPDEAKPMNLNQREAGSTIVLEAGESIIFQGMMREAPTWTDLKWLQANTALPIIVKGVTHPSDIERLLTMNIAGLLVSNHGGRALDSVPATLDLLPNIRKQVGADYPLLLDGGVTSGYDVFKALALGANAVCIGRLQMYALAVNGAKGVAHMLKLMRDELELCMALTGCPTIESINQDVIYNGEK